MHGVSREELVAFEEEVVAFFDSGRIRAPVHLSSGNEEQLIRIFHGVQARDWVLCSWRSHYHCLLKGVPKEELMGEILAGRSIALCFPEHRVVSSGIVGGHLPMAVGIAMGIKRSGGGERVWCFMGDMTSETGIAHECIKYAATHHLPLRFVIEDNGLSVCTETAVIWEDHYRFSWSQFGNCVRYTYKSRFPHAGAGRRVQF